MDKRDWISYNKKNIGWAIGLVAMTITFWFLVTNFGFGMFSSLRNSINSRSTKKFAKGLFMYQHQRSAMI